MEKSDNVMKGLCPEAPHHAVTHRVERPPARWTSHAGTKAVNSKGIEYGQAPKQTNDLCHAVLPREWARMKQAQRSTMPTRRRDMPYPHDEARCQAGVQRGGEHTAPATSGATPLTIRQGNGQFPYPHRQGRFRYARNDTDMLCKAIP